MYDLANLSLKFDRHLDAEVVDFQLLGDDYSKAAFLCTDRSVSLHARFGTYFKVRTPRQGRDLAYDAAAAELLITGSAPELWRLSLSEGRFMAPLALRAEGVNALGLAPAHGLVAAGGEDGSVECLDPRMRTGGGASSSAAWVDAAAAAGGAGQQVTSLRFDDAGLHLAAGTSGGLIALFDLRSSRPLLVKDHMYGSPIIDLKFHTTGGGSGGLGLITRRIISSDRHIIKIWEATSEWRVGHTESGMLSRCAPRTPCPASDFPNCAPPLPQRCQVFQLPCFVPPTPGQPTSSQHAPTSTPSAMFPPCSGRWLHQHRAHRGRHQRCVRVPRQRPSHGWM